ncbi:MAG: polysaccharide biosynthesis/export family protein [Pseudomonadota bacterium]
MQRLIKNFALILGLIVVTSGFTVQAAEDEGPYLLAPGDIVDITVLEDPELNRTVLVRPDGKIALPISGTLTAEGRSPEQLMRVIRSRLASNFIEPPNVTVSLTSIGQEEPDADETLSVYVLGEVQRPGRYDYRDDETLNILQALTLAGGPGPFAARSRIQVREMREEIETLRLFDYDAAEDGLLNTGSDLEDLADEAVIIVPERGLFE